MYSVQMHLKVLVNASVFHDVVFEVSGEKFFAHKIILCARSAFFRHKFTDPKWSHNQDCTVQVDAHPVHFQKYLEYLYTDQISNFSASDAVFLLELANYYNVPQLLQFCEQRIVDSMNVQNVGKFYGIAEKHQANQLHAICEHFMMYKFKAVQKTNSFKELDKTTKHVLENKWKEGKFNADKRWKDKLLSYVQREPCPEDVGLKFLFHDVYPFS